jgi:hypothetical protein
MPAFSFEKISPPVSQVTKTSAEKKQRGKIVRMLDRFVEARGKRALKSDRTAPADPKPKP